VNSDSLSERMCPGIPLATTPDEDRTSFEEVLHTKNW